MRKWCNRYQATGIDDLQSHSRRSHHSPNIKVGNKEEQLILKLRRTRNLGGRKLKSELIPLHGLSLAIATIHKVLYKNHVKPVKRIRKKSDFIRYEHPIPGDRVQMDTSKIGQSLYQYSVADDCARYRILRLYNHSTEANSFGFIDSVIDKMNFPIQRFKTGRHREFFAVKAQQKLKKLCI